MLVLDGVHRLPGETFGMLQRLIVDRELDLFDGTRLVRWEHYQELQAQGLVGPADDAINKFLSTTRSDTAALSDVSILPIHPSFRVVALGSVPSITEPWLHPDVVGMFNFHMMPTFTTDEVRSRVVRASALCCFHAGSCSTLAS